MTRRYFASTETSDRGNPAPVVRDRRRRNEAICYCTSTTMAKRIAMALDEHLQRRLPLAKQKAKA